VIPGTSCQNRTIRADERSWETRPIVSHDRMNGRNFVILQQSPHRTPKWFPLSNARLTPNSSPRQRLGKRRRLFLDPRRPSTLCHGKHFHAQASSGPRTMMAYSIWKKLITFRSFTRRHPRGELPHSRYVILGVILALTLSACLDIGCTPNSRDLSSAGGASCRRT